MKKLHLVAALIGGAALLASCIGLRKRESPLVVSVNGQNDGCRVIVDGERVSSERLRELARAAARRRAIVVYAADAPYKCIGGTIFTLQRAGIADVEAVRWDGD